MFNEYYFNIFDSEPQQDNLLSKTIDDLNDRHLYFMDPINVEIFINLFSNKLLKNVFDSYFDIKQKSNFLIVLQK